MPRSRPARQRPAQRVQRARPRHAHDNSRRHHRPRSELAGIIEFIQKTAEKYRLRIGTFGHMGDGNLQPTFLCDERNADEIHRVHEAFRELFDRTIAIRGTITGEHGTGLAKKDFLPSQAGQTGLDLMRALKKTLDPNNVLNPGKIFDI